MTKKWLTLALMVWGMGCNTSFADDLLSNPEVQAFIQKMKQTHNIDPAKLDKWFKQASIEPKVIEAIQRPYEGLPWHRYQPLFVTDSRIEAGVEFYHKHRETLKRAKEQFGVPEEIIVAILGVESRYGKVKGGYPVMNALVSLGFGYPPRAKFFLSELEQFLLLANEEDWGPETIKGSYAGAMGQAQFISSSYRRYAIDFNGDGKRDLINSPEDAIGSIANYFKVHGWEAGEPVIFPAKVSGEKYKNLEVSRSNPKPKYSVKDLKSAGVAAGHKGEIRIPSKHAQRLALIELEEKNGSSFWLGTQNFYAITRYNHSNLYAMAVYELSEKIKAQIS